MQKKHLILPSQSDADDWGLIGNDLAWIFCRDQKVEYLEHLKDLEELETHPSFDDICAIALNRKRLETKFPKFKLSLKDLECIWVHIGDVDLNEMPTQRAVLENYDPSEEWLNGEVTSCPVYPFSVGGAESQHEWIPHLNSFRDSISQTPDISQLENAFNEAKEFYDRGDIENSDSESSSDQKVHSSLRKEFRKDFVGLLDQVEKVIERKDVSEADVELLKIQAEPALEAWLSKTNGQSFAELLIRIREGKCSMRDLTAFSKYFQSSGD